MRGSFDNVCFVRYGSRSVTGPPGGARAANVPCRRVPQNEIEQRQEPLNLSMLWVTLDALVVTGPLTISPWLGAMYDDYLAADQIAFNNAPTVWYVACRAEWVMPYGLAPYYRYLLIPLLKVAYPFWPPPEPLPQPPVPAGLLYIAPGIDCAHPVMFDQWGDFQLSTQLDGTNGYYAFPVSPGESVRLSFVGGVIYGITSGVWSSNLHDNGCLGALLGGIGTAGASCLNFTPPADGVSGKITFSFANDDPLTPGFKTRGMRLENSLC